MHGPVAPALPLTRDLGLAYVSSAIISLAIAVIGSPLVQVSAGGDVADLMLGSPVLLT